MTTIVRRLVLFIIGGLIALMMAPALGVHHLSDLCLSCNQALAAVTGLLLIVALLIIAIIVHLQARKENP